MTWEDLVANAKKNNEELAKSSSGVVKKVTADSTWEDLVVNARKVNLQNKAKEQLQSGTSANAVRTQLRQSLGLEESQEQVWARKNESRRKQGLNLNVNDGQIYTFEPLTADELISSLKWADGEIERLKANGGTGKRLTEEINKFFALGGVGDYSGDSFAEAGNMGAFDDVKNIGENSNAIRELENYKAVINRYIESAEYEEAMSEINKNGDKELFSELYSIDTRKPTLVDSLGKAATSAMGGISMAEDKSSDIAREQEILTQLKAKYGDNLDYYRQLYANGVDSKYKSSIVKRIKEDIEAHPILGTIGYTAANVLTSPIRGIAALSDNIAEAAGNYSATGGSIFQDMSETTTQKVNEVINDTFKNKYAAGLVRSIYNAAVSGTESMLAMGTFGKLGEAVLGLGAATATYKQARERGLSDGQALMNGVAAGLFETLFEHISLGNLRAFQTAPATSLKSFVKNVFIQAGVEATEEGFTDLANEAYDYLINGGLSQYEQALYNGVTAEEYASQFGLQLVETLLTGALSGGGMVGAVTAPSAISGSINTVINDKATGNKIRQYGNVNEVLNEAKEQGGILAKKAAKTEKKLNDKKSVSDRALGQIERNTIRKQRAAAVDEILSGEEYKELSKKEKNAIRSSVLTFFSSNGQVAPEQGAVLQTENGKKVLEAAYNWAFDKADEKTAQVQENKRSEIRKAVSDKNTESLVKNTFTAVNSEGHTVEAGAVRSITDGVFEIVQDESGATAKLTDLNIKDRQARELYKELQTAAQAGVPLSVEAVNVALSMYNTYDNTSARMYALWAHDAYKAGAMGFTFNEFEEMFHGKYKGDITKAQLRELFEAGARNITTKVGLTRIGHKGLSKHQAEQVFIIEQLAKESGLEVLIVDEQLTDSEGRAVNGLYKEGTNRIVLSLQGEYNLILTHAGHEMFHYVKSQSTEMGQFLQDTVINILKAESKYDFEGIYKQVSEAYEGLSENDILEEIAAQYMAVALSNEKTINRIVNEASDTEKSFLQKIVDHLKEFIKSVKELLKIYGSQDKTVRAAVETPVEQLEYMADMFEKALKEAAKIKKPATETGEVKASRQFNNAKINNEIINLVNRVKENKFKPNEIVDFGNVNGKVATEIMNLTGFDVSNYSVVIEARQIEHILKDHGENGKTDHSLSDTADIAKMGFVLNEPDSISNAGRTQAYSYMEKGHNRTAKTVLYEKRIGEKSYYVVQAVPVTKAKKLFVVTAFIGEQGYKKEASQLINANSPDATTEYGSAILSNNTVPQNAQSVNNNDMQNGKKYSYAGINAKTHNIHTLEQAIRLENTGKATEEKIRQQTGWFRGYDGKWRFELDDSKAVFRAEGDVKLRQNERYRRLEELTEKYDSLTDDEVKELKALEKEFEDDIWREKYELQDYLDYPALYEAYPSLRHFAVAFEMLEPGVYGQFHRNRNMIVLRQGADEGLIKSALFHELQHAIQKLEGFAGGSSISYWEGVPPESKPGTYEYALKKRNEIGKRILESASPEFVQAFREYNRGELEYDDLEKIGNDEELDMLWEYDNADKVAEFLKEHGRSNERLYFTTAGEIEARDVVKRILLSADERKSTRPDIDRNDVVFAENEILSLDIKTDTDGNKFVDVNPELFDTRDGESHAKTIARIIKDRFNNLIFENGQQIQINKTTNDEWRRSNGADALRRRNPQGYFDKLKTIPYTDEILKAAKDWIGEERHHTRKDDIVEFARGNVYYRVGNNGYVADVIVAIRKNGNAVLYDLDDIRSKKITDVPLTMASKNPQRSAGTSAIDNITQPETEVKEKYSRQLISDSWEDIRTKMYEYEVHEDIIGEIESYIDNLKGRKLARETALTEGLIPKYEAILKVARQYTKGSEVSPQELADTINELMWAAHDGNLDTKQFISTVKLIAEDIIRTGKKIDDDMYHRYADFRKMTREETVYVEKRVYDQYVEEYGSVKNLNRAVAGKIKIKPYEDGKKTGRGLDDFYNELQEVFPELFKEDVDVYHQLFAILDIWQGIQPIAEYYSDILGIRTTADLQHQALIIAEDILSDVLGIKETVKTLADKYADKAAFQKEHYKEHYRKIAEEGRRKRKEAEEISILQKRILRNTNHLSDMIRNESDKKHIPKKLKQPIMDFLNMYIYKNLNGRNVLYSDGTLNMVNLEDAYKDFFVKTNEDNEEIIAPHYDEYIAKAIRYFAGKSGENLNMKKLNLDELQMLDKILRHLSHIIKHENEMFLEGRRVYYTKIATTAFDETDGHRKKPEYKTQKRILDAEYGVLTPAYFFKYIGTKNVNGEIQEEMLFKLFRELQIGQDKWYRNIEKSKHSIADIKAKHHYSDSWNRDTIEFTLSSGESIKVTAEEIMYMRALYIREQGHINHLNHLLQGGIIIESTGRLNSFRAKLEEIKETHKERVEFDKNSTKESKIISTLRVSLSEQDLQDMFSSLTDDMRNYADALVEMLSTDGSNLGNEVSYKFYGYDKFTEKNYIPISVASDALKEMLGKSVNENSKLRNRSFTKNTVKKANATVYVRGITQIAAGHMQEMSLYNAMTEPIENLTRIWNYQKPDSQEYDINGNLVTKTGDTFKGLFRSVYGDRGVKYFENLLRDLNGGNQTPARDFTSQMMSLFKRSAVTGSLSVAIQQPSAVVRACALVDAKYFVPKLYNKADYEEMLKYCPVAGIKEIGRFDTGLGQTATEWILDDKNSFLDNADDFLSFLPGMTDRMTWVYIWNAVKRETKANNKGVSGEELLELAAERFRDVIDYTQVYDSTLSRSAYMRDQGTGAKMVTAFMAEPTLSYNLLRDSLLNAREAPQQAVKGVFAFVGATLFNSLLKSFVTALRKDDEETNYWEVYISQFIENFSDDVNPLNMLPIIKDIKSIAEGYDVKRPDMSLIESLVNSGRVITNKLSKGKTPSWEECLSLVGTATALIGLPLNNVFKDFIAAIKTVQGLGKSPNFSIREVLTSERTTDAQRLYRAIIAKDEDSISRYKEINEDSVKDYMSQGYSEADAILKAADNAESNFHSKVIEGLISEDSRIQEAAEARLSSDTKTYEELLEELSEQGFDRNDVIKAVEKYITSMEDKAYKQSEKKDKSAYTYDDLFRAIDADDMTAAKAVFNSLTKEKTKETVQESLRDEYADDIYKAILSDNKNEKQRLINMFNSFDYEYNYAVTLGLRENDKRVLEAAKARYSGDTATYDRKKAEIVADGFEENDVFNAIEIETEKLSPAKEQDSSPEASYQYEAADLKRYAESFKLEPTRRAIEDFRARGKEDGDIRKELTSAFKKKYIEAWLSGDDATVMKIRDFLLSCNVGYDSGDFSTWEKEALKK